jgi:hypothetical protein
MTKPAMNDTPKEIAAHLIQEHGVDEAIGVAVDSVLKAKSERDNYALSIWREVRGILRKQKDKLESP